MADGPWNDFKPLEEEGPWSDYKKRRTPMQMAEHYAGLVGRGAVKGVVGSVEQFIPPIYPPGGVGRKVVGSIDPAVEKGLNQIGFPEPKNFTEKLVTGASEMLPGMVGGKGFRSPLRPKPMEGETLAKSAHTAIIDAGKAEGYVVPGQTNLAKIGQIAAGKTETRAAMTIRNQEVTNKIARREAGLAEDIPVTDANLKAARKVMAQPYEDLAVMSPAAARIWKQVQKVRAEAKVQSNFVNKHGTQGYQHPDEIKKLDALNAKATKLEDDLDKIAQTTLPPDTLGKLRNAREKLAKNYAVDRANTEGGNVDAKVIARDRGYKTGGLKLIADFEVERKPHFGVEMDLEPQLHMGGGVGLERIGIGGWLSHIPLVSPAGRALAMSKWGQGPSKSLTRDINPSLLFTPGLGLKPQREEE